MSKNTFSINIYIISSLLILLIYSYNSLNAYIWASCLIVQNLFFINIARFIVWDKVNLSFIGFLLFFIIQGLYLQQNSIRLLQPILIICVYIGLNNTIQRSRIDLNHLIFLRKMLMFIFPFFLITIKKWSDLRLGGLFVNPITRNNCYQMVDGKYNPDFQAGILKNIL